MSDWSIIGVPFIVALGVIAVVLLGLAVLLHVERRWRALLVLGGLGMVLVTAGAAVNSYYTWFRTVGDLFGQTAADEASASVLTSITSPPSTGKVVALPIPGKVSGFKARDAEVYVPAQWFRRPHPRLPVLMMFHGVPGSPDDWTRSGLLDLTTDDFAKENGGKAPIVVMPDINGSLLGDTECVDGSQGNAQTYLTVDVRDYIIEKLGTKTDARSWGVGGFSEGGTCAIILALRHPERFRTFLMFSGLAIPTFHSTVEDLFRGSRQAFDENSPPYLLATRRFPTLGGWFQVGTDDKDPYHDMQKLAPAAAAAGIETCFVPVPGGEHNFRTWGPSYTDALPWAASRLGLVEETPAMTAKCQGRLKQ